MVATAWKCLYCGTPLAEGEHCKRQLCVTACTAAARRMGAEAGGATGHIDLPHPIPVPVLSAFCEDATDPRYRTFRRETPGLPGEYVAQFLTEDWGICCEVSHPDGATMWRVDFEMGPAILGTARGWTVKVRSGGVAMGLAGAAVRLALALAERRAPEPVT